MKNAQVGCSPIFGVADWLYEFVRGGGAATHKFIPGLSNAGFWIASQGCKDSIQNRRSKISLLWQHASELLLDGFQRDLQIGKHTLGHCIWIDIFHALLNRLQ
jgi:hypothetical protein